MKKITALILAVVMVMLMTACASNPCAYCGDTPTKGYKNDASGEKEYYCSDCSSECFFCLGDADKHYTGGIGIIFVCNDCYEELESYGWFG